MHPRGRLRGLEGLVPLFALSHVALARAQNWLSLLLMCAYAS